MSLTATRLIYFVFLISSLLALSTAKEATTYDLSLDKTGAAKLQECSQDSTCRHPGTPRTSLVSDELTASTGLIHTQVDSQEQLTTRLKTFDTLEDGDISLPEEITGESNSYQLIEQEPSRTLQQVYLIHRHGDRTPIQFPPKDNLANEPFWKFHGYGQLTNRGKARLFLLGDIMRRRYGQFLKQSVNKNQRVSRASGSLRCIESAQVFLSSFLRLDDEQSEDAQRLQWSSAKSSIGSLWQPASVQTLASALDGMLAESATCKRLDQEYKLIDKSELVKNISTEYAHEAQVMMDSYGMDMDHYYKWFWASSQLEVEQSYFPDKMKPEIMAIYDRMVEAGNLALGAYQSTSNSKRLRSGLLMNDVISNMKMFRDLHHQASSDDIHVKKFFHYAAHDMTNIVLLGMLDNWERYPKRPDYASNIAFELHHDPADSQWFVRFFYMPQVRDSREEPFELYLDKCSNADSKSRCQLDRFELLMKPYTIDTWQNWMRECNNVLKLVDPYSPGR